MLSAEGIVRRYGSTAVLHGITFSLEQGESLGLFGPNGSGKSTLLDILALAARPDGGTVRMDGIKAGSYAAKLRRHIGYAPQEIALFEELTVRENLLCWSRLPSREAGRKALETASSLNLTDLLGKRVGALSGGMKRRVNLAVALLSDPELLVLDEPFAGVDAEHTDCMLELLIEKKRLGVTQILSGHSPEALLPLISRVMVLSAGRTVFFGDTASFLDQAEDGNAGRALKKVLGSAK
ncbi:MAG: ABC transporter ATP-binding protein [Clostridiales bacterium]|nr:ABC transporter ATP-binding protein [Clostridiales bacterium]